ncbi:hypothetical protein NDU88_010303 [Pleurodeles waltl]|uniref:Uncharacterized protein n=1 Tax=Pleurodeles waltl TaxID=8319 RepID=A0AAV7PZP7_PLEWA|nr:hypothetical protein NDU88_010303 [Pleurodeles waltl]
MKGPLATITEWHTDMTYCNRQSDVYHALLPPHGHPQDIWGPCQEYMQWRPRDMGEEEAVCSIPSFQCCLTLPLTGNRRLASQDALPLHFGVPPRRAQGGVHLADGEFRILLSPPRSGFAQEAGSFRSTSLPRRAAPHRTPLRGPVQPTRGSRRALTAERLSPGETVTWIQQRYYRPHLSVSSTVGGAEAYPRCLGQWRQGANGPHFSPSPSFFFLHSLSVVRFATRWLTTRVHLVSRSSPM